MAYEHFRSAEVASFWPFIASSLTRLVEVLDGMSTEELNWHPSAPGANSLYALAIHTLGNVEENVRETLGGTPVHRQRQAEFLAEGDNAETVRQRWQSLRPDVEACLAALTSSDLERRFSHPRRGDLNGREVLIVVARHAAEHLGQAELTRDLLRAAQSSS